MGQIRNSRLNPMAFNCDLDLESGWLSLTEMNIISKFNENLSVCSRGMK